MSELELAAEWRAGSDGDDSERQTFGELTIKVGSDGVPLTEVEDTIARSVRPHIYVPSAPVAEWFLMNWWRLRWEGRHEDGRRESAEWFRAHSLASLGHGYAWPAIEFSSDGEFVQVRSSAEATADVAGIRYLRNANLFIPAGDFESAVERFVDEVEGRLTTCLPHVRTITELRTELREERSKASTARTCRWQALAGINPGDASDDWVELVSDLASDVGDGACGEMLAAVENPKAARQVVQETKSSSTTIDLRWTTNVQHRQKRGELPWERGARAAAETRAHHHLPSGPLSDEALGELVSTTLPLAGEASKTAHVLGGGFRNGITNGRTAIIVPTRRTEGQRFYLARLIGCALASSDHFLAVTGASTAFQKFARSYGQELLCPWEALDAFTDEHGMDEEGVALAAEQFQVSQWLILSTLVNRGKLSRSRLPRPRLGSA